MAADYLLTIDGIKGEAIDKVIKDGIEIMSFSWGVMNSGSSGQGTGGGAGKANFQDISFTSSTNKASPVLFLNCANGTHIKKATLHVRKQGGEQLEYYTINFTDLLVSSFSSAGSHDIPTENFSFNFTKVEFEYKPQKPDGKLDTAIKAGWDIKANAKV